jgi:transposase
MGSSAGAALATIALQRSKSALGASFRRKARQTGGAVAVFDTARKLAKHIYRMLRFGQDYVDIGEQAYEQQHAVRRLAFIKEAARSLGFTLVEQVPTPAESPG